MGNEHISNSLDLKLLSRVITEIPILGQILNPVKYNMSNKANNLHYFSVILTVNSFDIQ